MMGVMQPTHGDADPAGAAPPPPAPPSPEELAPHFPQLEILECLGRGGMGVVYKARQKTLDRLVALKLLAPERKQDAAFAERFAHEARALAALNHPNIVTVHEFGRADGLYFLLMEYVDGVNLRQALQGGRFTARQALGIVPPICDALECAHDRGIVHRDIKPENILIDRAGAVKIADFGIAKIIGTASEPVSARGEAIAGSQPIGTPDYAAPEQRLAGGAVDQRADIYSLGVVLYEMLTGERPQGKIEPPSRRVQVDVRIDEIVLRALEQKPEMRFATAAEFRTEIEAEVEPPARTAPAEAEGASRWRPYAPAAAGVALFYAGLLLGIPFIGMIRVDRDWAYLVLVGFVLMVAAGAAYYVRGTTARMAARGQSPSWFRPLGALAFLMAIPVIGFAVFFAANFDTGFDHPTRSEAVLVALTFAGAFLLPAAGFIIRQVFQPAKQSGLARGCLVLFLVALAIVALLLVAPLATYLAVHRSTHSAAESQTAKIKSEEGALAAAERDRTALMQLSWREFDQSPGSGWRALSDRKQFAKAARLIEQYLAAHPELRPYEQVSLHFHAAQCFAHDGSKQSVANALAHLSAAKLNPEPINSPIRWNDYVSATEAFLKGDIASLRAARERIASGPQLDGEIPNLRVVDRLIERFGQPYREAYGGGAGEEK